MVIGAGGQDKLKSDGRPYWAGRDGASSGRHASMLWNLIWTGSICMVKLSADENAGAEAVWGPSSSLRRRVCRQILGRRRPLDLNKKLVRWGSAR